MQLCVTEELEPKLTAFFENIKDYSQDDDYMTTLNFVVEFLYKESINFILNFDWKSDIENFEIQIKSSLKDNFNREIDLPKANDYDERASISHDHLFEDFDHPLRQNGFQMGFIDTESDEYMIIIHKIIDREEVGNAVNKIGYNYFEK